VIDWFVCLCLSLFFNSFIFLDEKQNNLRKCQWKWKIEQTHPTHHTCWINCNLNLWGVAQKSLQLLVSGPWAILCKWKCLKWHVAMCLNLLSDVENPVKHRKNVFLVSPKIFRTAQTQHSRTDTVCAMILLTDSVSCACWLWWLGLPEKMFAQFSGDQLPMSVRVLWLLSSKFLVQHCVNSERKMFDWQTHAIELAQDTLFSQIFYDFSCWWHCFSICHCSKWSTRLCHWILVESHSSTSWNFRTLLAS